MDKEHILVVVPSVDGWITTSLGLFFAGCMVKNQDETYPYRFSVATLDECRGYAAVRNEAVRMFLARPACSRLWFVDADTILPPDIWDLPKVEGDIVSLLYPFVTTMSPAICNYRDVNDFTKGLVDPVPEADGCATISGNGMGCTLIRRAVLEDPRMRYLPTYETPDGRIESLGPDDAPPIFRYWVKPSGETLLGEDFDFGIRATRLGYRNRLWFGSQCGHLKTIDLNRARAAFAAQLGREDTKAYSI